MNRCQRDGLNELFQSPAAPHCAAFTVSTAMFSTPGDVPSVNVDLVSKRDGGRGEKRERERKKGCGKEVRGRWEGREREREGKRGNDVREREG